MEPRIARESLERAVDQFEGPLLRYAHRLAGSAETAQDLVQETFLRLCREPAVAMNGQLAQWLFAVCRSRAIDKWKKEGRMQLAGEKIADFSAGDVDPAAAIESAELSAKAIEHLAALPENQRRVVRLKFQQGLSYRQISEQTGLSTGNVGYLLHVALCSLRESLGREDKSSRPNE